MLCGVYAQNETFVPAQVVVADTTSANRFLAAENAKAIDKMQQNVIDALVKNNDDNFRAFDGRMNQMLDDTRMRVIVGGVGAVLIANALIGIVYVWVTRRYSYEHFLEKLLQKRVEDLRMEDSLPTPAVVPLSQGQLEASSPVWPQPVQEQTVSTYFGQQAAANLSDMNQWQFRPAYEGAWQRPGNVVSEVTWENAHREYDERPKNPWEYGGGLQ
jgi:hypothetical protein